MNLKPLVLAVKLALLEIAMPVQDRLAWQAYCRRMGWLK